MVPSFPPAAVVEKVQTLGYGTGPWSRDQFVDRWGAANADKFIRDGKSAGWVVSPRRGVYHIPAVDDLMLVPWLPKTVRDEFVIARSLEVSGLAYWCLSAWCRERGLDLGGPVFVTDLRKATEPAPQTGKKGSSVSAVRGTPVANDLTRKATDPALQTGKKRSRASAVRGTPVANGIARLRGDVVSRVTAVGDTLPWLDSLLIVPDLPPCGPAPQMTIVEAPESAEAENRRAVQKGAGLLAVGLSALVVRAIKKEYPDLSEFGAILDDDADARSIPVPIGPRMEDREWIVAMLAALGLARADEFIANLAERASGLDPAKIRRYATLIGPPQPNSDWAAAIADGPFPFLLVPPVLWDQMGADQAARRARALERLVVRPDA